MRLIFGIILIVFAGLFLFDALRGSIVSGATLSTMCQVFASSAILACGLAVLRDDR